MNPIIIVAVDKKNGIGKGGTLPWKIPEDMKFFQKETMDSVVIMGRTTYESIGKCLPGRENIVVSRSGGLGTRVPRVSSLGEAFQRAKYAGRSRIFVIGGEQLYRQALPYCNTVMLTQIPRDFECDRYFPELDLSEGPNGWKRLATKRAHAESLDDYLQITFFQRHEPVDFESLEFPGDGVPTRLPKRCENASVA